MQNKGFTLIETLVAIAILMIAIAGPLSIASKAHNAALGARDQMIATNLAQQSMEVLNYQKNTASGAWNPSGDTEIIDEKFERAVEIQTIDAIYTDKRYKVSVTVSWEDGLMSNEVKLSEVMTITNK